MPRQPRQPSNTWPQPADPGQIVVETIDDVAAGIGNRPSLTGIRLWSPPDAASIHGVLWFVALQQMARERFPDHRPDIVLDCGDRGDLAHAALKEGLGDICFRGSPGMLLKLRQIADALGAVVETRHPSLPD